jgi:hypothetical protein
MPVKAPAPVAAPFFLVNDNSVSLPLGRVARARKRSVRHDANEDRADLFEDGRTRLGRGMDIERAFDREAPIPCLSTGRLGGLLGGLMVKYGSGRTAHHAFLVGNRFERFLFGRVGENLPARAVSVIKANGGSSPPSCAGG